MQTLVIRTEQYTNNNLNIWAGTPQQLLKANYCGPQK